MLENADFEIQSNFIFFKELFKKMQICLWLSACISYLFSILLISWISVYLFVSSDYLSINLWKLMHDSPFDGYVSVCLIIWFWIYSFLCRWGQASHFKDQSSSCFMAVKLAGACDNYGEIVYLSLIYILFVDFGPNAETCWIYKDIFRGGDQVD
jgi:hypothetical protein